MNYKVKTIIEDTIDSIDAGDYAPVVNQYYEQASTAPSYANKEWSLLKQTLLDVGCVEADIDAAVDFVLYTALKRYLGLEVDRIKARNVMDDIPYELLKWFLKSTFGKSESEIYNIIDSLEVEYDGDNSVEFFKEEQYVRVHWR